MKFPHCVYYIVEAKYSSTKYIEVVFSEGKRRHAVGALAAGGGSRLFGGDRQLKVGHQSP